MSTNQTTNRFEALGAAFAMTIDRGRSEQDTNQPLAIRLLREDALRGTEDAYAVGWSRYKKALRAVALLDPERFSDGSSGITPLTEMDEEVVRLVHDAWEAGVYVGDAFAKAELALEVDRRICRRCNGGGVDRRAAGRPCCPVCGGEGTVPAGYRD